MKNLDCKYLANAFWSFIWWLIIRSACPIILALVWLIIAWTEFFDTLSLASTIYIIVTVDQLIILTLIACIAPEMILKKYRDMATEILLWTTPTSFAWACTIIITIVRLTAIIITTARLTPFSGYKYSVKLKLSYRD